jgi:hypothetical protein
MRVLALVFAFVCLLFAADDRFTGDWSSGQNDASGKIDIKLSEPAMVTFTLGDQEVKTKVLSLKKEVKGVQMQYEFDLDGRKLVSTLTGEVLGSKFAGRYETRPVGSDGIVDSGKFTASAK